MTLGDLVWFPPLIFAISVVLGASGPRPDAEIPGAIRARFVQLSVLMVCVAVAVRAIVVLLA